MGLFGALDDLGLTLGPALAAAAAVRRARRRPARRQRRLVRDQRDRDRRHPRHRRRRPPRRASPRCSPRRARASARSPRRPEVRALLGSSTAAVLCVGMTNVGEVVLAREVLDVGGSGLATLMTAGGVGTVLGSLARALHPHVGVAPGLPDRARLHGVRPARVRVRAGVLAAAAGVRDRRLRQRLRAGPRPAAALARAPRSRCTGACSRSRRPARRSRSRPPSWARAR